MANVWNFSPDAGTTKYDITDLQGRDDIDGINLFDPVNVGLISPETVGEGTFIGNTDNTAVVARIEHNTEYIARHEGGNRFRLALSMEKPVVGGACYTVVNDADAKSYTFNSGNYNYVLLHCNNVDLSLDTIKPMCYKSVYGANLPFHPYNQQSIQHQINDITGVTGVRNLLKNTATTQTMSGVTFTVNKDSNGNVLNINVNGTPSADIYFRISSKFNKNGTYYLNGIVNGSNTFRMQAYVYNTSNVFQRSYTDYGEGVEITINDGEYANIEIVIIASGGAISNTKVYPMIRLASDPDDTYVPYAMTNRELTDGLNTVSAKVNRYSGVFSGSQQGIVLSNRAKTKFTISNCKYVLFRLDISIGGLIKVGTYYLFKNVGNPGYAIHDIGKDTNIVIDTDMIITSLSDSELEFKFPSATTGVLAVLTVLGSNAQTSITTGVYD